MGARYAQADGRGGAPDIYEGVALGAKVVVTEAVASGAMPDTMELRGGMSVPGPRGVVVIIGDALGAPDKEVVPVLFIELALEGVDKTVVDEIPEETEEAEEAEEATDDDAEDAAA